MTIVDNGFNTYFSPAVPPTFDILNRAANRYVYSFLTSAPADTLADLANLLGPNDFSYVVSLAAAIHGHNAAAKVGMYAGAIAAGHVQYPTYDWLTDGDLLHHPDGSPVVKAPALSPAESGAERLKVINLSSSVTRAKLIANWISWLQINGFNGLLYDGWNAKFYAQTLNTVWASTGTLEIGAPAAGPYFWGAQAAWYAQWMSVYTTELTAAMQAVGLECWSNGLLDASTVYDPADPTDQIVGPSNTNLALYNAGVLSETSDGIWFGGARFTDWLTQADLVAPLGGRALYFFQPWILRFSDPFYVFGSGWPGPGPDGSGYSLPESAQYTAAITSGAFARFDLASFLLIHRPGSTCYGFSDNTAYTGYTPPPSSPYLYDGGSDWDQDVGAPLGAYTASTTGAVTIYTREYERAFVVVNPSDTTAGAFTVPGLYRAWDPDDGEPYIVAPDAPTVHIPAQTGLVLFKIATVTVTPWRLPVRARLYHPVLEEDGDVVKNRAVTVFDQDGVSAFGQVMYNAPTGGSVVTFPATDNLGRLTLYAPSGERVKLAISGVAGQVDSEFVPDPEDILTVGEAVHMNQYTGDADYMLTIQPTVGGAGGNKIASFKSQAGVNALKVGPHGVGSSTEVGVTLPVLVIDNDNGAPRLFADLSDGSAANRLLAQSSVVNGNSDFGVAPNGTGSLAALTAWAQGTPDTAQGVRMVASTSLQAGYLETISNGGSPAIDLLIRPNQNEALRFAVNGDVRMPAAGLATNANAGFFYVCSMAGTPSGSPAAVGGSIPLVYDRTAHKLWVNDGTWKSVTLA
jgi:hypothetical protein